VRQIWEGCAVEVVLYLLPYKSCVSGHFRFKHERAWDANIMSLSGELFSLDVDLLAHGLETIPLYQKLDLPISLFSVSF
jgi:hypothetical protein